MSRTNAELPPHSLEAEQAVLGSCLIDRETILALIPILKPSDFYRTAHSTIYAAITDLYRRREPVDITLLSEELSRANTLEDVGGESYLAELVASTPTARHATYYAERVREASIRRQMIEQCRSLIGLAWDEGTPVSDVLSQADSRMRGIMATGNRGGFQPMSTIVAEYFDSVGKPREVPLNLGFRTLDVAMGGLKRGEMLVVAARPGQGKTAFALQTAWNLASQGIGVALVSLETNKKQLTERLIGMSTGLNMAAFRVRTTPSSRDLHLITEALAKLDSLPLYIEDDSSGNINEVISHIHGLVATEHVQVVIVDYIGLLRSPRKEANRAAEVGDVTRALKVLSLQLNVAVIALSQLNRQVEYRKSNEPNLSDLRESGSIEQDADIVLFLWQQDKDYPRFVTWSIAKHRNGPTGQVNMEFDAKTTRFNEPQWV